MAKSVPSLLYTYTSWGRMCFSGTFDSIRKAKEEAKFLIRNGYAFSARIVSKNNKVL